MIRLNRLNPAYQEVPASSLVLDESQGIGIDQDIVEEVKYRYGTVYRLDIHVSDLFVNQLNSQSYLA